MEIKPEDIRVDVVSLGTTWGCSNGISVTVTHVPTGMAATSTGKISAHIAKHLAFEDLINRLNSESDYTKQLELF